MKKINKVLLISFFCILLIFFWLLITYYFLTKDAKLDKEKLIDYGNKITVCDNCGNEVINTSLFAKRKSVNLNDLNDYTVNAFIAAEDAKFYSHNGLNYKRILKAAYSNLISRSFKEGASTISQQLIKNTHLSSDKTIKRKLQ